MENRQILRLFNPRNDFNSFTDGRLIHFSSQLLENIHNDNRTLLSALRAAIGQCRPYQPFQPAMLRYSAEEIEEAICRICRDQVSNSRLISCPCHCRGTMGFVHVNCLKKWNHARHGIFNYCEICHQPYGDFNSKRNYMQLFRTFFQKKYFGKLLFYTFEMIFATTITLWNCKEFAMAIEENHLTALMPTISCVSYMYYLEWTMVAVFQIKSIIEHWLDGEQPDGYENSTGETDFDEFIDSLII